MRSLGQRTFEMNARKSCRPAKSQQTRQIRPDPVIRLATQFIRLIKFHRRRSPRLKVGYKGLDAGHLPAHPANIFQSQQRVFQMVKDSEKQHDIEVADISPGEPADVSQPVVNVRSQKLPRFQQMRIFCAINRQHFRAAPLHLETEPAVPCANIQHALSVKISGNGKLSKPQTLLFHRLQPFHGGSVWQVDGVIPAQLRQARSLPAALLDNTFISSFAHFTDSTLHIPCAVFRGLQGSAANFRSHSGPHG